MSCCMNVTVVVLHMLVLQRIHRAVMKTGARGSGGVFKAFANKIAKSTYFIKMLAATVSDRCCAEKDLM
mgnify:FL=1